MVFRFNFP